MSLPNFLTVARIILTVVFIFVLYQRGLTAKVAALTVFTLASLTDFYDGYLARRYNLITRFGKIMDPVADKFLILSAFFVFMQMRLIAVWMFVAIFIREAVVTGLRLAAMRKGEVMAAEGAGKIKTVSQITAIYLIMSFTICAQLNVGVSDGRWPAVGLNAIGALMVAIVGVTLWSGADFVWNNRRRIFDVR